MAKARGARVVATARDDKRAGLVRGLGADHVVDPSQGDLVKMVRDVAPEGGCAMASCATAAVHPPSPTAASPN